MNAESSKARDIFLAAIKLPPAEWELYIDQACGDDQDLKRRLVELLSAHREAGSFLAPEPPAFSRTIDHPADEPPIAEGPGALIGPYKLLQQLGEGGMGTVFLAQQTEPVERRVALKIIKPGMDSRQVIARFEAERQALALMDHPNIAKVLDAGTTAGGRPYFVMELVKGLPITKYCDQEHLTPTERLQLFIPVCQAVQHAHQKGIIHRDLKPSNVMIALYDGTPVPKVIDFGVAKATGQKLTERTMFTEVGQIVGTLEYMAPEQAELNNLDIDTRADIYSLGVLLYELLAGSPPFTAEQLKSAGFAEMLRMIREVDPPKPSARLSSSNALPSIAATRRLEPKKLTRLLHGDLDWIAMKCLEKERGRRYETANGLAVDIERYLTSEPVLACPPSAGYRLKKFLRRNKGPVLAATLVLMALVCGTVGTTWGLLQAERAWQAEANRADGERQAKQAAIAAAEAEKQAKTIAQARQAETQAVLDFVEKKVFSAARPLDEGGGLGYDVKLADAVKAALPFVDKSFAAQPLIEARLRMTMGNSFLYLGDAKTAIEQLEAARDLYIKHLGPNHRDTLGCMINLATSYAAAGRIQEALKLREETLQLQKARLGPDHTDTLTSMNGLANSYADAGRSQEALKLYEETLRLTKAKLGPYHPDTLGCMNNLAGSYANAGRSQEALELYEETLRLQKAKLGPDHPDTLASMHNLAESYAQVGRNEEALKLREETLSLQKVKLGPDHPDTLRSMNGLAKSYAEVGRGEEALKLREETLSLRKVKLGPDHPDTLKSMYYLANSYADAGRIQEALKLREETLSLRKVKLGHDHPLTLKSMYYLANSYADAGRIQEALKLSEEMARLMRAKLGLYHLDTLRSMNILANSYRAVGRIQDAIKLNEETLELMRARLGPYDRDTLLSMYDLGISYAYAGRNWEALKLNEETLRLRKAKFGPDHPDTLLSMNSLANSYAAVGHSEEALKLREETLQLTKAKLGSDHPNTLGCMYNLANAYAEVGRDQEALKLREETLSLRKVKLGPDHPDTLRSMNNLANSYAHAGRNQEALKLYEEAFQLMKAMLGPNNPDTLISMGNLARSLVKLDRGREAMPIIRAAAEMCEKLHRTDAHSLYEAACYRALTAAAIRDGKAPSAEEMRLANEQAERAMTWLKQAVAADYAGAAHMAKDEDLDALRGREDFKKLLAELAAKQKRPEDKNQQSAKEQ